ncbi:hypothetical protein F2Q68_00036486 [Brassica cretica]|uniref:Acetyl-CoA C-acetyltransferase n=1 Tax=Brassica cretica TaxID=69181 RepID=A0A8S9H562_BRACR|nr:hypothetical protein F2Q68_00036486 [Brassica cretica]
MVPLLTLYRIKSFNSMPFCRLRMAHTADSVNPRDVCIVGVARTPMGGFLGSLSSSPATKLGSVAIAAALKRANVDPSVVQEVVFGNVLSANLGQAPARQAALGAGIPNSVICTTVNKVCASGMKAVMIAAQSIQLGINDVVVAGGMESMSNTPKYLAEARKGSRFGHDSLVDGMLKDGLWDVYNDCGMGSCAELCAEKFEITREQQDDYAVQSFERGIAAQEAGAFTWEIVPVEVSGGKGRPSTIVDKDEGLGKVIYAPFWLHRLCINVLIYVPFSLLTLSLISQFDAAKLRKLRPSFKENGGTVTAGNASSIRFRMAHTTDSVNPRDVCIVGVARTPMGGFLGSLSSLPATKLGSVAIAAALKRANVDPSLVQEVVFGNVLSANLGQAPARQAALGAGIPNSVICTTVNKVCASGMKAVMIAAQSIQLGINDVVVAGGMESMSNTPKYLAEARKGSRFGNDSLVDGMLKDGLWDVYNDCGMGSCAELCAEKFQITREQQDDYAVQSFERGIAAQEAGAFTWEIVPVEVSGGRGRPSTIVEKDEGLGKALVSFIVFMSQFDAAKLRKLRPSFKDNGGTVTAGNASSISDGAAALVLVSGEKALQLGLQVLAKIKGYGDAAQEPEFFTTAPALAIPKAIAHAGLQSSQVDYYEINEAFAVVALANQKLLGITPEKVNVNGGAVSLGHPLGCSGARILITLLGILKNRNGKYGVGGVCNGGGGASALVLELV